MKLVLGTNILIAALIKDSNTRKLLLHPAFEFYIPEYGLMVSGQMTLISNNKAQ